MIVTERTFTSFQARPAAAGTPHGSDTAAGNFIGIFQIHIKCVSAGEACPGGEQEWEWM